MSLERGQEPGSDQQSDAKQTPAARSTDPDALNQLRRMIQDAVQRQSDGGPGLTAREAEHIVLRAREAGVPDDEILQVAESFGVGGIVAQVRAALSR
jgi:hypothetical protein